MDTTDIIKLFYRCVYSHVMFKATTSLLLVKFPKINFGKEFSNDKNNWLPPPAPLSLFMIYYYINTQSCYTLTIPPFSFITQSCYPSLLLLCTSNIVFSSSLYVLISTIVFSQHCLNTPSTPDKPMPSTRSRVSRKGTVSGVGSVFPCSNATPARWNGK